MAELPFDQATSRFKRNEDRFDTFINGDSNSYYSSDKGVYVPSVQNALLSLIAGNSYPLDVFNYGVGNEAVGAMAQAVGYVRFSRPFTLTSNLSIQVPVYFEIGASVGGPYQLTINNIITSPRQKIFRDDLTVVLGHNPATGSGEDARDTHASWWGAFPSSILGEDVAPYINRGFAAMGNGRESRMLFDFGNYNVNSKIQVTRGGLVQGDGERRTVFKAMSNFGDLFETLGDACYFQDIQFEDHNGVDRTSGAWINLKHKGCKVRRVQVGSAAVNIVVNALECEVRDVGAAFSKNYGAGSSLVQVNSSQCRVKNIYRLQGAFGPEAIVNIGSGSTSTISSVTVSDVDYDCNSVGVLIDSRTCSIVRIRINNVNYSGVQPIASIIKSETGSTFSFNNSIISGVQGSGAELKMINLLQGSTGLTSKIMFSNIIGSGSTNVGISLERTLGTLGDITLSSTVETSSKAIGLQKIGTVGVVRVSNAANIGVTTP